MDKPATGDCLDLAELCFVKKHFATAARLYAEALAGTSHLAEELRAGRRLNAACAAALAGCGQGDDAAGFGETEREELRKQARDWLRLDLAAWARKVNTGTAADRIVARKTLARWRDDPDLAGLRDGRALEGLPPAERRECQALWQEVADLLRRAETPR
jgi:serine/threonine-protein kinase